MIITVPDGALVTQSLSDVRVYEFDFDAENLPAGVLLTGATPTITAAVVSPSGATLPTLDNKAWVTGNRKARVRIAGGVQRADYAVTIAAVTNENPAQTKTKYFLLQIT